jgi:signal transduction histidine kinase
VDQDGAGEYFHPLQYVERLATAANAPTYSWVDSTDRPGGRRRHGEEPDAQVSRGGRHGLARAARRTADAIPVSRPDLNQHQIDWRQLRRWGLSESRLPAGALVLFRDPSPWDRYRPYIVSALLLLAAQSALIVGLLIQRRQRRKAEERLIESQTELRASYDRIHDLGSRLLKAQETERAHIARELHDDVGQQLALMEMDVKLLGSRPAVEASLVGELLDLVQGVGRSLRELSHRLHPAKLRLIGLVVALKGLQTEMSQSGIEIVFTHDTVPVLPPDLTLCLFG